MSSVKSSRVGYVVKRYPRYSETFIVNEILAHEAAGLEIEIFSLRAPSDAYFQDVISKVKSPVNYLSLPEEGLKATEFWAALDEAGRVLPGLFPNLKEARGEEARDVYQAAMLARAARLKGICHLHAHFATSAASVARLAAHFAGLPYTFTAHAKDIFHESINPDDLRRKLNEAAAVITVSDYNLEYLYKTYSPLMTRINRVYNGLDLEKFPYLSSHDRSLRIVAVGRLVEKKGFADLIEACAVLVERGCRFDCEIIGTGPLEDELRMRIKNLGLEKSVKLIGSRPQNEVIDHVRNAAVFAAPCVVGRDGNRDGLPTVLLEAMALGTPCVSTDVTGIPEVIIHKETGLMIPQHDPSALASAIETLLADPALRVQLATGARRLIEAEFDIARNTACLRRIFQASDGATSKIRLEGR